MELKIERNITATNKTPGGSTARIKYIVVHYTANDGDSAYNNTKYFKNAYRGASAHYFVDETSVWQCVDDKDIAWHCGTSGKYYHESCRNDNSIGVELCSEIDSKGEYYFNRKTVERGTALIKQLMKKYNITVDRVLRHYDVTHKNCPAPLIDEKRWQRFKNKLVSDE